MRALSSALALSAVVSVVAIALPSRATKPCPDNPCRPTGAFDANACSAAAAWVAVGRVGKITSTKSNVDGAELTFYRAELVVDAWEKGSGPKILQLDNRWCWDGPPHQEGVYRIWGLEAPNADGAAVMAFERVAASPSASATQSPAAPPPAVEPSARGGHCSCRTAGAASSSPWIALAAVLTLASARKWKRPSA